MGWARLDDGFFGHRKTLAVSKDARLLFLAGVAYCAGQLTDGFVALSSARAVAGQQGINLSRCARELVDAEMWHKRADGWDIHGYLEYQPTAESERGRRDRISAARAEAGRVGGVRSGATRRSKPGSKTRSKAGTNGEATSEANGEPNTQANRSPDPEPITPNSSFSDSRPAPPAAELEDANSEKPEVNVVTGQMVGYLLKPTPKAAGECRAVARWALGHLDQRFVEECVGIVGTLNGKPRSGAYFAVAIRDMAAQRGFEIPEFRCS